MQFHHNGYVSGDPRIQPADGTGLNRSVELPSTMDVLIVGAGPAGMVTAAQLSRFPSITTRIIERRGERLNLGHADGIQARSVETFQAFGFAERVMQEGYRITEMAFWQPDPANPANIVRSSRAIDDPTRISEFPHLIVNQARILDYFREYMEFSPTRMTPDYGWEFVNLRICPEDEYPVVVNVVRSGGAHKGEERTIRAKYLLGADGAHSAVRRAMGAQMKGDRSNVAWGVMDVLAKTDFPDIRTKCAIQSTADGNILHIPREGGHLFRMYVDLGEITEDNKETIRATSFEDIAARARKILHPYTLEVQHVCWFTVYEVGHRVTDHFDDVRPEDRGRRDPRVFIAGDACHTHSAKAGQGMNVSMQDAFNLGWKLGYVLDGRSPASLLSTYSDERQVIAQNLIDFDREWAKLMARPAGEFEDRAYLEEFYQKTWEFPAGFMTEYPPSLLIGKPDHQSLAAGFPLGKRFKSELAMRVCDANPLQIGHQATADGRWRIYVFADAPAPGSQSASEAFAHWLGEDLASPVVHFTPEGADIDAWFDVHVIYQQKHTEIDLGKVPAVFLPQVGPFQLTNREKVWATHPRTDIFAERAISRDGAIVIVRPDQYVAHLLPLSVRDELTSYFTQLLFAQDAKPSRLQSY